MNVKVTGNHVVQGLIYNAKERSCYTGSDRELLQDFKRGLALLDLFSPILSG